MTDATDAMFVNRAPGSYTATETLSSPWTMVGVTCNGGSPTPGADSVSFSLAAGATVTCTFTNQTSRTFEVNKDFMPDNGGSVTVALSCGSGTATATDSSASEADDADFTVTGFSGDPNCIATESGVPSGYTTNTCNALLSAGSCTIINAQTGTTFTVNKAWVPASGASVSVTVSCTGGGTVVEGAQNVSTASPQTWNIVGFSGTPTCTATETVPAGYTGSGSPAGTCSGTAPGNCTITNTRNDTTFTVNKVWSPTSGASVSVTVSCTGGGTVVEGAQSVSTASPQTWNIQGYSTTPNCTATESPIPAGYMASGSPAGTCSGTAPGDCTITNTLNTATFTVNKTWVPASGASVSVTVTCTGGGTVVEGAQDVSTASPQTWTINGFTSTPTCTATESPIPAGYNASGSPAGTCSGTISSGTGSCTITNTLSSATFNVNKNFIPDNGGSVTVSLSCASGTASATDSSASETDDANFDVTGFTGDPTCTATESGVPAGYTVNSCNAPLSAGSCTINNPQTTTTFTVNKVWVPANAASVSVTVTCTGGGTVVEGAQSVSTASPQTWTINGFTSTPTCTATESPIPAGYNASGSPPGTCSGTAPGSCSITNTQSSAPFNVNKNFVPDNGASVTISLSCASGTASASDSSASEADDANFTVSGFTGDPTCTATETGVPAGYTTNSCNAPLSAGSCTITNPQTSATFTVNKVWLPASAASVPVTVTCTGGGTVVEGSQNVSTASPQTWTVNGFSSPPTCTATETIPSGYTASGSPAGTCSGAAPGNCTITNTLIVTPPPTTPAPTTPAPTVDPASVTPNPSAVGGLVDLFVGNDSDGSGAAGGLGLLVVGLLMAVVAAAGAAWAVKRR
jgi:hypothetical protein